jgi:hypothetical protein
MSTTSYNLSAGPVSPTAGPPDAKLGPPLGRTSSRRRGSAAAGSAAERDRAAYS